jgi:hypothetical protein
MRISPSSAEMSHAMSEAHKPCAFVTLVMRDRQYVAGALVAAHSLRRVRTRHQLVCMVTPDLCGSDQAVLSLVFDLVVEVPYLRKRCEPLKTSNQERLYKDWVADSFTKWNCLGLTQFDKVIFFDADKIALHNVDELFDLPAPAGTFSSPWSEPFVEKKSPVRNAYDDLGHGQLISRQAIRKGFREDSYVCIGTMVLLAPNQQDYHDFVLWLDRFPEPFGFSTCYSMMDEQAIVRFYYEERPERQWTFVHQVFNYIPWRRSWLPDPTWVPRVFHYFGKKPWDFRRSDWPDLEVWWTLADQLVHSLGWNDCERTALCQQFSQDLWKPSTVLQCAWCLSNNTDGKHSTLDCPDLYNDASIEPVMMGLPHVA